MTEPTQSIKFWQDRWKIAIADGTPSKAIGHGMDWDYIDRVHLEIVRKYIKPEDKILDIGCGIGRTAHWFPDDKYIGFDFVPEFLEQAKKDYPNKKFLLIDLKEPLPFKDKEFDWGLMVSLSGVVKGVVGEEKWAEIEKELKRVCSKLLDLPYTRPVIDWEII